MEQNNQQPQQNPTTSNNSNQNPPAPAPAPQPQFQQQPPQPKPQPPQIKPQPAQNPPKPMPAAQNPKQSKKNLIISGAVILIVLILLLVVPHLKNSTGTPVKSGTKTEETISDDDNTMDQDEGAPLSRTAALAAYQGKMVTIADDCKVTPAEQAQATGTTILIDNGSTVRHTITVGPKSYTVSGQHYTLSWLNLPAGTLKVTCDGKDTGSTIVVR